MLDDEIAILSFITQQLVHEYTRGTDLIYVTYV